jgi:tRNA-dihydrouridine synthase B
MWYLPQTMQPIKIEHITYEKPLYMAPMEGITDVPFRKLVRKHGAGITCTQMIHAQGLIFGKESRRIIETSTMTQHEKPVGFQLCGNDPKLVGEAAKRAQDLGADFIDLNMGCPAKNVVNNGGGAALLQDPDLAATVVESIRKNTTIPATVKIRVGWNDDSRNYLTVGKKMEAAGASLISVHARTRSQKYTGKANWNWIAELKKEVSIPVIGNGDILSYQDVLEKMKATGADGVMIGRGALGNPWIFSGKIPTVKEVYETMLEHLNDHLTYYNHADVAYRTFRKHIVWYTKGLPYSAEFRDKAFKERDNTVLMENIHRYFSELDQSKLVQKDFSEDEDQEMTES